ncbi:MAG: hypothetical protein HY706_05085 [Candidatus Hydrogenedentes bacterium]|nr:hypothetical protein [Candidatus Hydrogenedentota bacterium]
METASATDWTASVCLCVTPRGADIAHGRVRFEVPATVTVENGQWQDLGVMSSQKSYTALAQIRLPKQGRFEIRGWAESLDPSDQVIFGRSKAVYVIATKDRVLSGEGSFLTVELTELKRQKEAGTISYDEYQKRSKSLMGHRASDSVERKSTLK